jgi:hypothetical protein
VTLPSLISNWYQRLIPHTSQILSSTGTNILDLNKICDTSHIKLDLLEIGLNVVDWIGLVWLRIGTGGELL